MKDIIEEPIINETIPTRTEIITSLSLESLNIFLIEFLLAFVGIKKPPHTLL